MRIATTLTTWMVVLTAFTARAAAPDPVEVELEHGFSDTVQPFLNSYCIKCHSGEKAKGELDLKQFSSMSLVVKEYPRWALVHEKLGAKEMPPEDAKEQPSAEARLRMMQWVEAVRKHETIKHAGDPGIVLARRLSNAEFNYTIRDLTGVDMQPTREFPADLANTAGFDNSGESLVMSPELLDKYLKAAREMASHMFLKPSGFAFAPYPMLAETDRDKYCVMQIINFYHQFDTDYADYFLGAWRFKHRAALGKPNATLDELATIGNISAKYLSTIWSVLEGPKAEVGPAVKLQAMWRELPAPAGANQADIARKGCGAMRDYVVQLRGKVEPRFLNLGGGRGGGGGQPALIWKNVQYATHRMSFDPGQLQVEGEPPTPPLDVANEPGAAGEFGPGRTRPVINTVGDPDLVVPAGQRAQYEAAFGAFCKVFPDKFYMEERGRNYFDTTKDRGRYLSAGFHSLMGYFRDDAPLHELLCDAKQQKELDEMWDEMDFVASTNARMYMQSYSNGSRQGAGGAAATAPAAPISDEDRAVTSEVRIKAAEARAIQSAGADAVAARAAKDYFEFINERVRWMEKARIDAEPSHLDALYQFAARAYRRPLASDEKADLLAFYKTCREKDGLDHEAAIRELIVGVLMSPDLGYRIDLIDAGNATAAAPAAGVMGIHPLSDYNLASRLSYFLWSSMPDDELLSHAAAGDLHQPKVIAAQAARMLKDPRSRALAVEFGGNWLDFRRFEELNTVDRSRFTTFTPELRQAMFEEPVRFLSDVFQNNRSMLDCLYANDTFVNPALAKHYGMAATGTRATDWVHIPDASKYDRGGLLPMAVFLTKNAPGLRTSPVKRGNWVVKNVLGERIPPPPATVPELPKDETKLNLPLRDMLAQHRADPGCAACHARFDSMGLVFEGYGPIGERRTKDLAGRAVDASATFPGGGEGTGLAGLRQYIREHRQNDFIDSLCGKLIAYGLGRSLILSDDLLIQEMHARSAADGYRFGSLIESIVTSPQFLTKRGNEALAGK